MVHILFLCTGNTFRSASAEYLLRDYARKQHDTSLTVSAAGTRGNPLGVYPQTLAAVRTHGVDMSHHRFSVLDERIITQADIIICMTKAHQKVVQKNFSAKSYLFNQLAVGENTDIQDDDEAHIWPGDPRFDLFVQRTVDTIASGIPAIYDFVRNHQSL